MEIKCNTKDSLPVSELVDFQGTLKERTTDDYEKILRSIKKHGFSFPFFVWQHNGINHVLDGHGRLGAIQRLVAQGEEIPPLPVVYVDCKDEADAKELLLKLNSHYGQMTAQSVADFLGDLKIDFADLALPEISTRAWKEKVGDSRPVLLKKNIIERNTGRHKEFLGKDKEIISNALYGNDQVLLCKAKEKPNYYAVVKTGEYYDVATIDTDNNKKYAEVVDWRRIREKSFRQMKEADSLNKKDTPTGDQSRITGVKDGDRSAGLNSDLQGVYETVLYYEGRKVKSIAELWEEIRKYKTTI